MTSFADLLDPADRDRLAALGSPPPNEDLAASARAAAADSAGTGRVAWACVTVALDKTQTSAEARALLADMIEDGELRTVALDCLTALCNGTGG